MTDAEVRATLLQWRDEKDRAFAQPGQSPILESDLDGFDGLRYFEPDPALRFVLPVVPFESIDLVEMETSQGEPVAYERFGRLDFEVGGVACRLTVYRDPGHGSLFLPFRDAASGAETYGAGRYVDLEAERADVVLDFNYAYNPFCAYSPQWVCPVPPAENTLSVAIRAGERTFGEPRVATGGRTGG